jgi:quinol-cytochrome oxidoreductase complex cytochrome b subunit
VSNVPENPASRFFVFVYAILAYVAAIVVYFHAVPGFTTGVWVCVSLGSLLLAVGLFGSRSTCDAIATLLTLGSWHG